MDAVKLACGCAVVAAIVAGPLSRLDLTRRADTLRPTAVGVPAGLAVSATAGFGIPGQSAGPGATFAIDPDRYGQFQTEVEIDGQHLPVVVDTGASFVSLTFEDADRLGIRPMPADFRYKATTANGVAAIAKINVPEIRLGAITIHNVPAFVSSRGALFKSLLGMSFLSRLSGLRVDGGRLLLTQ